MKDWLDDYYNRYKMSLFQTNVYDKLIQLKNLCLSVKENKSKIILCGNGASSTIASHASTDFTKQAKIPAICFSDAGLITAYGNDYGYENWVSEGILSYHGINDLIILISSSGSSKNIVNAAQTAKKLNLKVVTFTGFSENNPLKSIGDLNFWFPSKAYNVIENTHSIWITSVIDMIIGNAEYNVK